MIKKIYQGETLNPPLADDKDPQGEDIGELLTFWQRPFVNTNYTADQKNGGGLKTEGYVYVPNNC